MSPSFSRERRQRSRSPLGRPAQRDGAGVPATAATASVRAEPATSSLGILDMVNLQPLKFPAFAKAARSALVKAAGSATRTAAPSLPQYDVRRDLHVTQQRHLAGQPLSPAYRTPAVHAPEPAFDGASAAPAIHGAPSTAFSAPGRLPVAELPQAAAIPSISIPAGPSEPFDAASAAQPRFTFTLWDEPIAKVDASALAAVRERDVPAQDLTPWVASNATASQSERAFFDDTGAATFVPPRTASDGPDGATAQLQDVLMSALPVSTPAGDLRPFAFETLRVRARSSVVGKDRSPSPSRQTVAAPQQATVTPERSGSSVQPAPTNADIREYLFLRPESPAAATSAVAGEPPAIATLLDAGKHPGTVNVEARNESFDADQTRLSEGDDGGRETAPRSLPMAMVTGGSAGFGVTVRQLVRGPPSASSSSTPAIRGGASPTPLAFSRTATMPTFPAAAAPIYSSGSASSTRSGTLSSSHLYGIPGTAPPLQPASGDLAAKDPLPQPGPGRAFVFSDQDEEGQRQALISRPVPSEAAQLQPAASGGVIHEQQPQSAQPPTAKQTPARSTAKKKSKNSAPPPPVVAATTPRMSRLAMETAAASAAAKSAAARRTPSPIDQDAPRDVRKRSPVRTSPGAGRVLLEQVLRAAAAESSNVPAPVPAVVPAPSTAETTITRPNAAPLTSGRSRSVSPRNKRGGGSTPLGKSPARVWRKVDESVPASGGRGRPGGAREAPSVPAQSPTIVSSGQLQDESAQGTTYSAGRAPGTPEPTPPVAAAVRTPTPSRRRGRASAVHEAAPSHSPISPLIAVLPSPPSPPAPALCAPSSRSPSPLTPAAPPRTPRPRLSLPLGGAPASSSPPRPPAAATATTSATPPGKNVQIPPPEPMASVPPAQPRPSVPALVLDFAAQAPPPHSRSHSSGSSASASSSKRGTAHSSPSWTPVLRPKAWAITLPESVPISPPPDELPSFAALPPLALPLPPPAPASAPEAAPSPKATPAPASAPEAAVQPPATVERRTSPQLAGKPQPDAPADAQEQPEVTAKPAPQHIPAPNLVRPTAPVRALPPGPSPSASRYAARGPAAGARRSPSPGKVPPLGRTRFEEVLPKAPHTQSSPTARTGDPIDAGTGNGYTASDVLDLLASDDEDDARDLSSLGASSPLRSSLLRSRGSGRLASSAATPMFSAAAARNSLRLLRRQRSQQRLAATNEAVSLRDSSSLSTPAATMGTVALAETGRASRPPQSVSSPAAARELRRQTSAFHMDRQSSPSPPAPSAARYERDSVDGDSDNSDDDLGSSAVELDDGVPEPEPPAAAIARRRASYQPAASAHPLSPLPPRDAFPPPLPPVLLSPDASSVPRSAERAPQSLPQQQPAHASSPSARFSFRKTSSFRGSLSGRQQQRVGGGEGGDGDSEEQDRVDAQLDVMLSSVLDHHRNALSGLASPGSKASASAPSPARAPLSIDPALAGLLRAASIPPPPSVSGRAHGLPLASPQRSPVKLGSPVAYSFVDGRWD